MTKGRWTLLICGIAIWLLSGGPSIHCVDSIYGEHDFVTAGVKFQFFFHPSFSKHGVPLVYHYFGAGLPARMRLLVEEPSDEFVTLFVDQMTLVPNDRQGQVLEATWNQDFRPSAAYEWNEKAGKAEKTKSQYCEGNSELIIQEVGSYQFSVKGRLLRSDKTEVPFASKALIDVRTQRGFALYPYVFVYLIESSYKT